MLPGNEGIASHTKKQSFKNELLFFFSDLKMVPEKLFNILLRINTTLRIFKVTASLSRPDQVLVNSGDVSYASE